MCGIFGYANFNRQARINREILVKMSQTIRHRGPDDQGFYIEDNMGFGNNRLAIIDLISGRQPIANEDETIWVTFNGEIYNYQEISKILIKNGHLLKTHTDSEILVHLYEDMGIGLLDAIEGMFSFALWDKRNRKLFLARDRLGIKPLYYFLDNNKIIFASELRAILAHPDMLKELDVDSLKYYFIYGYMPDPISIFKNVKKIPPAGYLYLCEGKVNLETYWQPFAECSRVNEHVAAEKLLFLLRDSVRKHLACDVPLGIFLSGGIDSSIITYLAATQSKDKIKAFNISFDDAEYDESQYAKTAISNLRVEYYNKKISSKEIISSSRAMLSKLDEPLADSSFIPTYLLSSFAKKYVKVCLSGDGADEIFAGYPSYMAHSFAEAYKKIPPCIRKNIIEYLVDKIPIKNSNNKIDFLLRIFIAGANYAGVERSIVWFGPLAPNQIDNLFTRELTELQSKESIFAAVREYAEKRFSEESLEKYLFTDRRFYLPGNILTKVDRASMANSLEVRVPYLDHRIVELVNSMPAILKLNRLKSKYILKRAFQNKLPRSLLKRKKQGFNIAVGKLLKNGLLDAFSDLLNKKFIMHQGIFEYSFIQKLISEHISSQRDNRRPIWALIVFQVWYEQFVGTSA